MTTTIIVVVIGFLIYWMFIKDGKYKQGVGELKNGDYIKASNSFNDAIIKNPEHYKAEFHLAICYKEQAVYFQPTDVRHLDFKKRAIDHFLRASEINSGFLQSNNMLEMFISTEKDMKVKKEMVDYTKKQINNSASNLKEQYSWINNF